MALNTRANADARADPGKVPDPAVPDPRASSHGVFGQKKGGVQIHEAKTPETRGQVGGAGHGQAGLDHASDHQAQPRGPSRACPLQCPQYS